MSKATCSAEVDSATTDEGIDSEGIDSNGSPDGADVLSVDEQPTLTPNATSRALETPTSEYTSSLYGTDRAAARTIAEKSETHSTSDIESVEVKRYGNHLDVRLRGDVCLSSSDVQRVIADSYQFYKILAHSSGSVTVTLADSS